MNEINALELKNVSLNLSGFSLRDISFQMPMGSALGLIGENGAGKSTTISLILGLLAADSGEIRVLDHPRDENFEAVKEKIGVVFDESCFPDGITARQVDRIEKCIYQNWNSESYFEHLHRFDLPPQKPFKNYSRGMKMKLALAVALSHDARLLILDEATGGLDPMARDELLDELADFISDGNHAILLSSHIIGDIEKLCDRVAFLYKGRLILDVEKCELLEKHPNQTLEQIILEMTREERRK